MRDAVAIVQARLNSSRLPSKVMADVCGRPILGMVFDRLKKCQTVADIICAIPPCDTALAKFCRQEGIKVVYGPEEDVLTRYVIAARTVIQDKIVRITSDTPLISYEATDALVESFNEYIDYANNIDAVEGIGGMVDGCNCEVFWRDTLSRLSRVTKDSWREHVTGVARKDPHSFKTAFYGYGENVDDIRHITLMVDEAKDLEVVRFICQRLNNDSYEELVRVIRANKAEIEAMR